MTSQSVSTKEEQEQCDNNSFDEEFYLDLHKVNLLDED